MRTTLFTALTAALVGLTAAGCGPSKPFDGPTVDAFNGKVVHDGKPVSFPAGETDQLKLFHESGQSFGIPLQQDGSFKIGWMPIGKYSVMLIRTKQEGSKKAAPNSTYKVPDGLTIQDGQTEYTIELGKNWKP